MSFFIRWCYELRHSLDQTLLDEAYLSFSEFMCCRYISFSYTKRKIIALSRTHYCSLEYFFSRSTYFNRTPKDTLAAHHLKSTALRLCTTEFNGILQTNKALKQSNCSANNGKFVSKLLPFRK